MNGNEAQLPDYYSYNFEILGLSANAADSASQQIEASANFIWVKTSGFADIAAAVQTHDTRVVPLVTLQVTDVGSGRSLYDGPAAWSNVVGWGEIPYMLPLKRKWQANTAIRIDAFNFSAATTYNLRLSLSGYKNFGAIRQE